MSKYLKPLAAVLVYVVVQGVTCMLALAWTLVDSIKDKAAQGGAPLFADGNVPEEMPDVPDGLMSAVIIVSGLITMCVLAKPMGVLRFPQAFDVRSVHWGKTLTAILGCVAGVLAINLFTERLHLADWSGDMLTGLMDIPVGIFAVGVMGPVVEEAIFREALLGDLLLRKVRPGVAIAISALIFGCIHANPAQIPGAAFIGLLLGIVYWRTGNIVLTSLLHIANNLFCVAQYHVLGDSVATFTLTDWLGGDPVALLVMAASAALCAGLMMRFVRLYPAEQSPLDSDDDLKYA